MLANWSDVNEHARFVLSVLTAAAASSSVHGTGNAPPAGGVQAGILSAFPPYRSEMATIAPSTPAPISANLRKPVWSTRSVSTTAANIQNINLLRFQVR